jgi:phosphatidylinositol alpha 1,6-mannosyltransferase
VAVFQTDIAGFARRHGLGFADPVIWRWLRRVHHRADLTLAPSTSSMWLLKANGITEVAHWGRGVDLEQFHPDRRSETLHRQLAPGGEVIVGYVGRLAKEKQLERLGPISTMRGVRLVLVGDGPERLHLERRLPHATFTGFRSGVDLARTLATFDVFVTTGLDETFCQAVQEALASGVPVVAPAVGGPLDLVTHGSNGFLWSPAQPVSLVGAVAELVADRARRTAMGHAARASVLERPWPVVMDRLVEYYRVVIGAAASRRRVVA